MSEEKKTITFEQAKEQVLNETKDKIAIESGNWEPIGKAEIIYTAAACCGLGAIVGWITIEDK
jgi:hypothetical protein